jgi:hypothetical protein
MQLHRSHRHARPGRSGGRVTVLMVTMLIFGLTASAALADSPHFIRSSGAIDTQTGAYIINWKEAGLGDNQLIHYVATADATATYVCVNNGGGNPSARNKTTVSGPVSAEGTFSSGKNGQITESLTLGPPSAGSFSCPPGQSLQLALVSYSNIVLTDTTNDVSIGNPNISSGCLLPRVRGACD